MYPINLILDDKECLILGGGAVAAQKAKGLLDAGAVITVLSPSLCPSLQELADQGDITWLKKLYDFIRNLNNVKKVEVLPYHTFGEYKWKELGYDYPLQGIEPPSKERIENANRLLHTAEFPGH